MHEFLFHHSFFSSNSDIYFPVRRALAMYLCQTNEYSLLTCTVLFSCITLKALLQYTLLVKHRVLLTEGIVMQEVECMRAES